MGECENSQLTTINNKLFDEKYSNQKLDYNFDKIFTNLSNEIEHLSNTDLYEYGKSGPANKILLTNLYEKNAYTQIELLQGQVVRHSLLHDEFIKELDKKS